MWSIVAILLGLLRSAATTSVGVGRRHSSATVFCRTALFSLGWIPGADLVAPLLLLSL